ncbi:MAG TPA: hypothetical protein VJN71_00390 [Nitrososphaerales archaeon]|nr:hypothetical protein [Nitrososphaerales archaeon]
MGFDTKCRMLLVLKVKSEEIGQDQAARDPRDSIRFLLEEETALSELENVVS